MLVPCQNDTVHRNTADDVIQYGINSVRPLRSFTHFNVTRLLNVPYIWIPLAAVLGRVVGFYPRGFPAAPLCRSGVGIRHPGTVVAVGCNAAAAHTCTGEILNRFSAKFRKVVWDYFHIQYYTSFQKEYIRLDQKNKKT